MEGICRECVERKTVIQVPKFPVTVEAEAAGWQAHLGEWAANCKFTIWESCDCKGLGKKIVLHWRGVLERSRGQLSMCVAEALKEKAEGMREFVYHGQDTVGSSTRKHQRGERLCP